jgi:hypothetical protein
MDMNELLTRLRTLPYEVSSQAEILLDNLNDGFPGTEEELVWKFVATSADYAFHDAVIEVLR